MLPNPLTDAELDALKKEISRSAGVERGLVVPVPTLERLLERLARAEAGVHAAWIRRTNAAPPRPSSASGNAWYSLEVIPFGRAKGKRLGVATVEDLRFARDVVRASLEDPSKARFAEANRKLLRAIDLEIEARLA